MGTAQGFPHHARVFPGRQAAVPPTFVHSPGRMNPTPDTLTVAVTVNSTLERAWQAFTTPQDITQWNFASADWCCPASQVDLREGGRFSARMEARDGSMGFNFSGLYTHVDPCRELRFVLGEQLGAGREVVVQFQAQGDAVLVSETFTPENVYSLEQQRAGWQSILEQYKRHVEAKA
jgi:uncharacterized protein YndB with AHSA1/START domain